MFDRAKLFGTFLGNWRKKMFNFLMDLFYFIHNLIFLPFVYVVTLKFY